MQLDLRTVIHRGIITISFIIVSLILWNILVFIEQFKHEERQKMEILALAYKRLNTADLNTDVSVENYILDSNTSIPMILTDDKDNILFHVNLNSEDVSQTHQKELLKSMKKANKAIEINYRNQVKQYIYYDDSNIVRKLKYFPLSLLLVLLLFTLAVYLYDRSNKIALQNRLWTGMAKETAHQIGTPLTSLMGWVALLKDDEETLFTANEMEKDIKRLEIIANRFSKIGSMPVLKPSDIVLFTKQTMLYLKSRASKNVSFSFNSTDENIEVNLNRDLYSWVIENLIKNALDAMQGKGHIKINIIDKEDRVKIKVSDSGKGIPKKLHKKIFTPGFTTKKRGWGLGLSLTKRIIEDFHKGKIYVLASEAGKGSVFQIVMMK